MSSVDHPAGHHARVLIVDDVPDNREVLARRFSRRGYDIVEADGGLAALDIVAQGGVDLVLLDILMPDMSGLEVLERIRALHSPLQLPVIMVTAQAESRDIVLGLELGANDYITKPVDFPVALARVATQIGRRRAELDLLNANRALHDKVGELHDAVRRAEAANRAKDEFLANMSHEIRTPLNGVTGVAYVLAATSLDEHQRELVGIITSSAALLDQLLSDVLDMARAERGQVECRPQPVNLREVTRAVAGLGDGAARAKGLQFEVRIDPNVPEVVEVDPARLSQILINLLNNAVKFTSEGKVTLEVVASEEAVSFAVLDTGIGFDPAMKDRLFERFEQADGSITRRFGGSGLGLAISHRLSQLMGATLDARSRPGEGAVFTLDLPLRPPALAA